VGAPGLAPGYKFQPALAGDHIAFFGNGFGPTTPPIPAGQVVSQSNSLPNVVVQFGGMNATVEFTGEVAIGVYQINAMVPPGLSGDVTLTMTVNGIPLTQNLYITLQ
ncbi:MAG: IPT/TIG domain-containing protein, partial [Acidobacteriia bacterium]|nr:IPT/TIG domain-containing protein [Terriglobia bacterium]